MKKFLDSWRRYILNEETVLKESAKGPNDILAWERKHPGYKLFCELREIAEDKECIVSLRAYKKGSRDLFVGKVEVGKTMDDFDGPCLDGYNIIWSEADEGFGPMLYDIAMEWATSKGSGLMADRDSVSKSAKAVWDFYDKKRDDVSKQQLDIQNPGYRQLTPRDPKDDCDQRASLSYAKPKSQWHKQSISKMFKSNGTPTIDKLREIGRLRTRNA